VQQPSTSSRRFPIVRILVAIVLAWLAARYFPLSTFSQKPKKENVVWSASNTANLKRSKVSFGHPYYRYSIIPGGAYSRLELERALARDKVAAAHFADFRVSNTRVMTLDQDHYSYISYRIGDRVYWTSQPVLLLKGEKLLTDGVHLARTRCGNRLGVRPPAQAVVAPIKLFSAPVDIVFDPPKLEVPKLELPPAIPFEEAAGTPPVLPQQLASLEAPFQPPPVETADYVPSPEKSPPVFVREGYQPNSIAPGRDSFPFQLQPPPVSAVPEPGDLALAGLLFLGCGAFLRSRIRTGRNA
jgi:hypothetical protein